MLEGATTIVFARPERRGRSKYYFRQTKHEEPHSVNLDYRVPAPRTPLRSLKREPCVRNAFPGKTRSTLNWPERFGIVFIEDFVQQNRKTLQN